MRFAASADSVTYLPYLPASPFQPSVLQSRTNSRLTQGNFIVYQLDIPTPLRAIIRNNSNDDIQL